MKWRYNEEKEKTRRRTKRKGKKQRHLIDQGHWSTYRDRYRIILDPFSSQLPSFLHSRHILVVIVALVGRLDSTILCTTCYFLLLRTPKNRKFPIVFHADFTSTRKNERATVSIHIRQSSWRFLSQNTVDENVRNSQVKFELYIHQNLLYSNKIINACMIMRLLIHNSMTQENE